MTFLLFAGVTATWSGLGLWHALKFIRGTKRWYEVERRHWPQNIVHAYAAFSLVYLSARQLSWVPLVPTTYVLMGLFTAGIFGLWLAYHYRSQR